MPTDAMLRLPVVVPSDRATYAQQLVSRLSKAHQYMFDIAKELRRHQKEYYDIGRRSMQFNVGDYVIVHRKPRSKTSTIAAKWLPRWEGPYQITEHLPNSDNYRLKHVETGKTLDPTNVDKLVRVEPWTTTDNQQHDATNDELPPQNVISPPISSASDNVEVDQFVIFERRGENTKDDDMQTLLKTVFDYLKKNNGKMSSGEVCKHLYSTNPDYRKLVKSVGGIRKLVCHTSSIEFVMPDCGGNNYLQIVGNL